MPRPKRLRLSRRELIALHRHSDKAAAELLDEWVATLRGLAELPADAQVLADLLADNYAFALANPVTLDQFAGAYLPVRATKGYSTTAYEKARDSRLKLKFQLQKDGVNTYALEDLPRQLRDPKVKRTVKAKITEYLGCLEFLKVVRKWFTQARRKLQNVLYQEDSLGYILLVENVPSTYTDGGTKGYIIPGTVRALEYFIGRKSERVTFDQDLLQNLRDAVKAVRASPDKKPTKKRATRRKKAAGKKQPVKRKAATKTT